MTQSNETEVAEHYNVSGLGELILDALRRSNIDLKALKPSDLSAVDEFHMGGRAATQYVIGLMGLRPGARVLDVGCGLGGVARYLAGECGCRVTGVDLTPEYVRVARMLTEMTQLSGNIDFHTGSALDLPFPDDTFDAAVTFHVAMNIEDRPRLYAEVARVIRPGGLFAIYDVMKGSKEGMCFPVPWAETAQTSFLVTPDAMRQLLAQAGFDIVHEEDRRAVGLEHHRSRVAGLSAAGGPPPLGSHLLQGKTASLKSRNMIGMLEAEQITVEAIIARRRA
jgi:MPBQ/MSBQ methyltransferase